MAITAPLSTNIKREKLGRQHPSYWTATCPCGCWRKCYWLVKLLLFSVLLRFTMKQPIYLNFDTMILVWYSGFSVFHGQVLKKYLLVTSDQLFLFSYFLVCKKGWSHWKVVALRSRSPGMRPNNMNEFGTRPGKRLQFANWKDPPWMAGFHVYFIYGTFRYPLVNIQKTMERSTMLYRWVNPLFRLGHFQ